MDSTWDSDIRHSSSNPRTITDSYCVVSSLVQMGACQD